jgi:hypothetical protein
MFFVFNYQCRSWQLVGHDPGLLPKLADSEVFMSRIRLQDSTNILHWHDLNQISMFVYGNFKSARTS